MGSKNLYDIFYDNDRNKLVLPDFQRELEWKVDRQKYLLSSFIVGLPIGSLLLLEGSNKDFAAKQICFPKKTIKPMAECTYLLDGQQRLTSLRNIFSDFFSNINNWTSKFDDIYPDLRYRWFLNVIPKPGEEDVFGWENLSFKRVEQYEPKQVMEMLETKRLYKKGVADWFNPGYVAIDVKKKVLTGHQRNNHIAQKASESGLIPLYSIYNTKKAKKDNLHELALRQIATKKMLDLRVFATTDKKIVNCLKNVDPDIKAKIKCNDSKSIDLSWSLLSAAWVEKVKNFLNGLLDQDISVITVPSNQIHRAISIYESINLGGTPLSTFDLIVARAARDKNYDSLTKRIISELNNKITIPSELTHYIVGQNSNISNWDSSNIGALVDNKLSRTIKDQYLNLLSIYSHTTYGNVSEITVNHTKKSKQLELTENYINKNHKDTITSIIRACAFIHFRCGVVKIQDLPYELMLLPIAYVLKDDKFWYNLDYHNKIEHWYWSSLFSGAYREAQNEQCRNDISALFKWLNGEINGIDYHNKRFDNIGYSDKKTLLKEEVASGVVIDIPRAIDKAILQYILSNQPIDLLPNTSQKYYLNTWNIAQKGHFTYNNLSYELEVQDHHIWPLSNATTIGQSSKDIRSDRSHILNSPLNRTFISKTANSIISDYSPVQYFAVVSKLSLITHCIPKLYQTVANETLDKYFRRVLEARFDEIEKTLTVELHKLVP